MTETNAAPASGDPFAAVRFESRAEFNEQLLYAIGSAQREVWLADGDFSRWPMNSLEMEEALRTFLLASRANRLHLLALDDASLTQKSPRFMRLMRLFGHAIFCRQPGEQIASRFGEECSFAIVDRTRIVRRFHRDTMRGVAEFHPNQIGPWVDQFQSIWDDSTPSAAATVLGLGA
jgi:hypothetical protein